MAVLALSFGQIYPENALLFGCSSTTCHKELALIIIIKKAPTVWTIDMLKKKYKNADMMLNDANN